jgi:hypothetical protein
MIGALKKYLTRSISQLFSLSLKFFQFISAFPEKLSADFQKNCVGISLEKGCAITIINKH